MNGTNFCLSLHEHTHISVVQATFRAYSYQVYLAHCTWDWNLKLGGRSKTTKDWLKHTDEVLTHFVGVADELCRFLTLPTASLGRHRFTSYGRKEAIRTHQVGFRLFDSLPTQRMTRITVLTEELKNYGLTEVSIVCAESWLASC